MIDSWIIVGLVVFILYIWSGVKDREKTIRAFKKSGKFVAKSLPLFFLAVLLIGFIAIALDDFIASTFADVNLGIMAATLLGFLLPGPRYAIYPLATEILMTGGNVGAVMALIASQQLIDVPEGCFIEIKYLGNKFFLARLVIATITSIAAGYLAFYVNFIFPLWTMP